MEMRGEWVICCCEFNKDAISIEYFNWEWVPGYTEGCKCGWVGVVSMKSKRTCLISYFKLYITLHILCRLFNFGNKIKELAMHS